MAIFIAESDGVAKGAELSERPLGEMSFERIVKALTLFVHVLWGGDEDAAMVVKNVLDERATLGFG